MAISQLTPFLTPPTTASARQTAYPSTDKAQEPAAPQDSGTAFCPPRKPCWIVTRRLTDLLVVSSPAVSLDSEETSRALLCPSLNPRPAVSKARNRVGNTWRIRVVRENCGATSLQRRRGSTQNFRPLPSATPFPATRLAGGVDVRLLPIMVYCGKPSKGCSNCRERKIRVSLPFPAVCLSSPPRPAATVCHFLRVGLPSRPRSSQAT